MAEFYVDSSLAMRYQLEWANEIREQGRNPYEQFAVAHARGRVLGPMRPLGAIKRALGAKVWLPTPDDEHYEPGDFTVGAYTDNVTGVEFDKRGMGRVIATERTPT